MKDYTHELSVKFVEYIKGEEQYSVEKNTVITYGIELIFNSLLKTIIYLCIGALCGKLTETLVVIFIFGFVRVFAGGVHMKEDTGCFVMTGILIGLGVISPKICSQYVQIHFKVIWIGINIIYLLFAGNAECDKNNYQKLKSIFVINLLLFCSCWLSNYWKVIVVSTIVLEGITLINVRRNENEGCKKVRRKDGN